MSAKSKQMVFNVLHKLDAKLLLSIKFNYNNA